MTMAPLPPTCRMTGTGTTECPICLRYLERGSPLPCVDHDDDDLANDGWTCEDADLGFVGGDIP